MEPALSLFPTNPDQYHLPGHDFLIMPSFARSPKPAGGVFSGVE
jgi:hypothetical protein